MKILFLLPMLFPLIASADSKNIVLSEGKIGPMKIEENMKISLKSISRSFPFHRVTHELGQGDSPDFHVFKISTHDGELLISFTSFIEYENEYEAGVVDLDEVVVYGKDIKDQFGVYPGMLVKNVAKLRAELDFGHGHMSDFYLGKDNIWYVFQIPFEPGRKIGVTKESVLNSGAKIDILSWPYPKWR